MLTAVKEKSGRITETRRIGNALYLYSERGRHRIVPMSERTVRVSYTQCGEFSKKKKAGVTGRADFSEWEYVRANGEIVLSMPELCVKICEETASFSYYNREGVLLLAERDQQSKTLESFTAYRLVKAGTVERTKTPDGIKESVRDAVRMPCGELYHTRLYLQWQEGEALYGLGQQEEGILNLRGQMIYVHQANRKIAIPVLLSSLGYGILMDTYSPMIFSDTVYGSYLYTEADEELDFYFMNGGGMNGVVREYRGLTGKASMLPKWAFGYLQSQERYETQEEICRIAGAYRERGIGLDGIILDWLSWEDGLWGQKTFDPSRFPDPDHMVQVLRDQDIHFMISIWPSMDEKSENYREMKERNLLLPASNIYNPMAEEGRELYWRQAKEGLYCHGVDAWWCDSSEPFTPEWRHKERVEPSIMYAEYVRETGDHLREEERNVFALFHARAVYEGQRGEIEKGGPDKRVFLLTRSAYTGQQRYGTVMWSGDTAASWDTLRCQIASGLNFCASGLPYWTADIGAFFVKNGNCWYWKGEYDRTTEDPGYLELFTRWYQWGAFLPVFRGHGTDCRREIWMYQGENGFFYNAMLKTNRIRYELMPYIYSTAGKVWLRDDSMIRMLVFDFQQDREVFDLGDQYLFGEYLMVCPVTEAMYFGRDGERISGKRPMREVYLPKGCGWYDFWTGQYFAGGQRIEAGAPIDRIPVFVREGSILPMAEAAVSTAQSGHLKFRVYAGRDCDYELYWDAGDGYGYERGAYQLTRFLWSEKTQTLCDETGKRIVCTVIRKKKEDDRT